MVFTSRPRSLITRLIVALSWLVVMPAAQSAAQKYYVLAPEHMAGDLAIMSLEINNTITAGLVQAKLGVYETANIPSSELIPGTIISSTGSFVVGSNQNAADLLAPDALAGTSFVIPHITGDHTYYLFATTQNANVTVTRGGVSTSLVVFKDTVTEFGAGSDNNVVGIVTSDQPILVVHVANVSGAVRDAYPVPPAATSLVGVRSQNVVLAAGATAATVTVYASNSTSGTYNLQAGEKVTVTTGAATDQGQGSVLNISATAPVAAVQYDDGDGADATAFWSSGNFAKRYGIPVNTQYVVVGCLQANVSVTLFKGAAAPETQTCSGSSTTPGKAYFGSASSGANLTAGWYLLSSAAVYAMAEPTASNDEANTLGWNTDPGPTAPSLDTLPASTSNNPLTISGTGPVGITIRLYVNGLLRASTTADGCTGAYSFAAELFDGNNVIYTTAFTSNTESVPSTVQQVTYTNSLTRTPGATFTGNAVWTPGNPASYYTLPTNFTISSGATLTLQPGTELRSASGSKIIVSGKLIVKGMPGNPVVFGCSAGTCSRGGWTGIEIANGSSGSVIKGADIQWATTAINIVAGGAAKVEYNTISNFQTNGVLVSSTAAGIEIRGNTIDNGNDTGSCVYASNSSPLIVGNVLRNCLRGIYVYQNSSPTVNGWNDITSNDYGVQIEGSGAHNPAPVITGNRIYANDVRNVDTDGYSTGSANVVNATNNWWGSGAAYTVAAGIWDLTDAATAADLPVVNYGPWYTTVAGSPATGNFLNGPFTAATTTLTADTTYDVLGTLIVPSGKSLVVPAGVTLRVHPANGALRVDGTLAVNGTGTNKVRITSGRAAPARGDYLGVRIGSTATGVTVTHAILEYGTRLFETVSANATLANSTLQNFSDAGVYLSGSSSSTQITSNSFNNFTKPTNTHCIEVTTSSAVITGNQVSGCDHGVEIGAASSPTINGGNVVTANNYGLYVFGNGAAGTQPVVNSNQIFGNGSGAAGRDYNTVGSWDTSVILNAQNNWWGTTDPATIADRINDQSDNAARPTVDFSYYLTSPSGSPVAGDFLIGPLTLATTTIASGSTYTVLGTVTVPTGKSLVIQNGATVKFSGANTELRVNGTLTVSGTVGSKVLLTSASTSPVAGAWKGILVADAGGSASIDYATVEWAETGAERTAGTLVVQNSTVRRFKTNGIRFQGGTNANKAIGNLIDNLAATSTTRCIVTYDAAPDLQGNTVKNCGRGFSIERNSSPAINTGNIATQNSYGVYLIGSGGNPTPVATGNQFYGNGGTATGRDVFADGYSNAANVTVDFTANWWGTPHPYIIADHIRDRTDASESATDTPVINYANYLNAASGSQMTGNYLNGSLTASQSLTTGLTYDILGTVIVPAGMTLTVPAGVTLRLHPENAQIRVFGSLQLNGANGNRVKVTAGRPAPVRGSWHSIGFRTGSTGNTIAFTDIEWGSYAVQTKGGVNLDLTDSTVHSFEFRGIDLEGASSTSDLTNVVVDNLDELTTEEAGDCLYLNGSSPTIGGSTFGHCENGIEITGTSLPVITGSVIRFNDYGIKLAGGAPDPTVNSSSIYDNGIPSAGGTPLAGRDYFVDGISYAVGRNLNAQGNYWGTTSIETISNHITDLTDSWEASDRAVVDYRGFLDVPSGTAVPGDQIVGWQPNATTLSAGSAYDVLGIVAIESGKTLTIPGGTTLRFYAPATRLRVDGTLQINGSSTAMATLTSGRNPRTNNDWGGIGVRHPAAGTAGSISVNHAIIENAWRPIEVKRTANSNVAVAVQNSVIRSFADAGVYLEKVNATGTVSGNFIDNLSVSGSVKCIEGVDSAAAISGNRVHRCVDGIFLSGGSSTPAITSNVVMYNTRGIYLSANNSVAGSPNPTITGNDIYQNTSNQLQANDYVTTNNPPPVIVNATANWWGTATPTKGSTGSTVVVSSGTPVEAVDISSPATSPSGGAALASSAVSEPYFSPNGDSVKDSTTLTATLSESATWTLTVRNASGTEVRTYSSTGTNISQVWDGKNASNVVQADGQYTLEVSVPGSPSPVVIGTRQVVLDITSPSTAIASPTGGSSLTNATSVAVTGTANDSNLQTWTLEYGSGAAPSSWSNLKTDSAKINNTLLANWVIASTTGGGGLSSGTYTVRVTASDLAGNTATTPIQVTVSNLLISAVSQSVQQIRPVLGEALTVNFTLSGPGTATLRIYPELGGALVREISQVFTTGGAKSLSWNGKNASNQFVPDEAYEYVLSVTDGTLTATYDLTTPTLVGSGCCSSPNANSSGIDSAFNANRNDFWQMQYWLAGNTSVKGRVRMKVSTCVSPALYLFNWTPYVGGTVNLVWDGRDAAGNLAAGQCGFYFDPPKTLNPASVIVKGVAPTVSGAGYVEAKSTPWEVRHSYEQIANFVFRVDQNSYVTAKLLPPGVSDLSSPEAIVLLNNQLREAADGCGTPYDHSLEWRGYDIADTNNISVSAEGTWTIALQTTGVTTGVTTLYRGALQLYQ